MSRCIVCNAVLKPEEIVWKQELGEHETHCSVCLQAHENDKLDSVPNWDEGDFDN